MRTYLQYAYNNKGNINGKKEEERIITEVLKSRLTGCFCYHEEIGKKSSSSFDNGIPNSFTGIIDTLCNQNPLIDLLDLAIVEQETEEFLGYFGQVYSYQDHSIQNSEEQRALLTWCVLDRNGIHITRQESH